MAKSNYLVVGTIWNILSTLWRFNKYIFSGKIIREKCSPCRGNGKIEQAEEVRIDVPAGISQNERVRIGAHGHEIYVSFDVQNSTDMRREGLDIHSDINVSVAQAVLGGRYFICKNIYFS